MSLKADSVKHILKQHSSDTERLRGQEPIVLNNFELIPSIVSNYDTIQQTCMTKQNKLAILFGKQICDYYLVGYVSDKNHNLEV